jgi:hypothetical protein
MALTAQNGSVARFSAVQRIERLGEQTDVIAARANNQITSGLARGALARALAVEDGDRQVRINGDVELPVSWEIAQNLEITTSPSVGVTPNIGLHIYHFRREYLD